MTTLGDRDEARADVLARIRTALGPAAAGSPAAGTPAAGIPRAYATGGAHGPGDPALLDLFADRLVDYRATVHPCGPGEVAATVAAALGERSARRVVVPPGLDPAWLTGWDGEALADDPGAPLPVERLDTSDGVVTACAVAIAETGTIVLDGSPTCGRRVLTLVPDYHLVVVRAEQVVASVPEAVARMEPRRPLTLISGPSATSDIELNRVEGVHGPRTLVVVLVG